MKKTIITSILILLFEYSFSQTKQDTLNAIKKDSTLRLIVNKTVIDEFQKWLYENISAKQFNEIFAMWYNSFVEFKYQQTLKEKPKTTAK